MYIFHIASHTGTRILAVVDSATHAATPMLSLLSSSKPDRDTPMLGRLSSSKPRQDTDHSLSSFSKPHRQTDPSLLSCSKPDRDTDLSSVPSVKPDRGFNLSFFIRPATLGHLSSSLHPARQTGTSILNSSRIFGWSCLVASLRLQ